MNTWLLVGGGIALVLALLVARGMYVIGSGSDAEMQARAMSTDRVSRSGWVALDWLREGDVPFVSDIEAWLGWNQDEEEKKEVEEP